MAYASEQNFKDRLGSDVVALLADEDGDGSGDTLILAAVLDDAASRIDATLSRRYVTPISPITDSLIRLNVDLAIYLLFLRRRDAISPEHLENSKRAQEYLNDIAEGREELGGVEPKMTRFALESTTRSAQRRFDRDKLDSY